MTRTILAVLIAGLCAGCLSEINRPIQPGERWGGTADILTAPTSDSSY